jgi:hypothetical protein
MKNRTLLISLWSSSLIFIIITIGSFLLKFSENKISNDPAVWGQFGDYFGGILNPILSLINLIILTYLSMRLVNDEDERNKWTLQELVRPYGEISFINSPNSIEIILENCGMGPLIINKILITDGVNENTKNFSELIKSIKTVSSYEYELYNLTEEHGTVGKEKMITLIKVEGDAADNDFFNFLKEIEEKLTGLEILVTYSDMYKRKMDTLKAKINFYKHT